MDAKRVQKELLKALRGSRTQGRISQRLGYKFNMVYRWESGRAKISWPEFVRLCAACKADLEGALKISVHYEGQLDRSDLLVLHLAGRSNLGESAKFFEVSRFTFSDWINGKRSPSLEQVLKLLHTVHLAVEFVGRLVDIEQVPRLTTQHKQEARKRKNLSTNPNVYMAQLALELIEYKSMKAHEEGYVARKLGVSLAEEKMFLQELARQGAIEWAEGKYRILGSKFIWNSDWKDHKRLMEHWTLRGLERLGSLESPPINETFNFMTYSVSSTTRTQLAKAYKDYIYKVRMLIMDDKADPEEIFVLSVQLFRTV